MAVSGELTVCKAPAKLKLPWYSKTFLKVGRSAKGTELAQGKYFKNISQINRLHFSKSHKVLWNGHVGIVSGGILLEQKSNIVRERLWSLVYVMSLLSSYWIFAYSLFMLQLSLYYYFSTGKLLYKLQVLLRASR